MPANILQLQGVYLPDCHIKHVQKPLKKLMNPGCEEGVLGQGYPSRRYCF